MRVTTLPPPPRIASFVRRLTIVEASEETTRVLIPDSGLIVGFRYSGYAEQIEGSEVVRMPGFSVAGLRDTARRMRTSARGGLILATFRDGAASEVFRGSLDELFGATVALEELLPRRVIERAGERIALARTDAERVSELAQFLFESRQPRGMDPVVAAAADMIRITSGSIRVRTLAGRLGISVNRLEDRFRRAVGASPKRLAAIVRFQKAMAVYRRGGSLTEAAAAAGYADQPHFTRDFRARLGDSPGRFLKTAEHC